MEDIRTFIKIMENLNEKDLSDFDNSSIGKNLNKDFDDVFAKRDKKKDFKKVKSPFKYRDGKLRGSGGKVDEGPMSRAFKIGAFSVLLNLTGGVSADERDVMGTSIQAVQQMQTIPDSKRKDIIKRELIKSAQASIGEYKGRFAYIYLDKDEQQLHDELVRLGISKPFANMIMISLIKAELGDKYLTHPALAYK